MDSLDTRIAHALGWQLINADESPSNDVNGDPVEGGPAWVDASGTWQACAWAFHPLRDSAAIPLLLAEVERRGKKGQYLDYLIAHTAINTDARDQAWRLLTATPEQHCRAFLAVIGDVNAAA